MHVGFHGGFEAYVNREAKEQSGVEDMNWSHFLIDTLRHRASYLDSVTEPDTEH